MCSWSLQSVCEMTLVEDTCINNPDSQKTTGCSSSSLKCWKCPMSSPLENNCVAWCGLWQHFMGSLVFLRAGQVKTLVGDSSGERRQLLPLTGSVQPYSVVLHQRNTTGSFLCLILQVPGEYLEMWISSQLWLFRYLLIDISTGKFAQVFFHILLSKQIYLLKRNGW